MSQIYEKSILIDFGWLSNILCSSIESYDDETFGLLGGENRKNGIQLFTAPALLSAERGSDFVNYNHEPEKYELAKEMIDTLGLHLVGCFHSHPDSIPHPSEADIHSCVVEQIVLESQNISSFDWWLEMIVGITKKEYKYNYTPTVKCEIDENSLKAKIKHGSIGWNIDIRGHWIQAVELHNNQYYPNRHPASFKFNHKNFPSSWE